MPATVIFPATVNVVAPAPAAEISAQALSSVGEAAGLADGTGSHSHPGGEDLGGSLGGGGDGAAALQQLSTATTFTAADSVPGTTLHVQAPVDSAEFQQGAADRVSFAVENNWNSAKLQVNPAQLGPIELQIAVQGDRAQVVMSTHSAVTREALESSLPKLKEMLGSQGFTQVSVDISQRSFQDRSAFSPPYTWAATDSATQAKSAGASVQSVPSSTAPARVSLGVVDAYA
jgi:flagellar hook-length control protein FliK